MPLVRGRLKLVIALIAKLSVFWLLLYSQKRQIIDVAMVVLTGIFSVEMTMKVNRCY